MNVALATALLVAYDKGILVDSSDGEFQARLALRTQFRLETTRPTDDGAETESRFVIPRARLQIDGYIYGKATRYKLEFGLGDRGSFSFIRDLYVEHAFGPVTFRVGQWKRPFNRQELVSDFGSELNERAITAEFAGGGRDVGVALHNDYEKSPEGLEWALGVFNTFSGGSDRPTIATSCEEDPATMEIACTNLAATNVPADFGPAVIARVGWNFGKIKGYSEGDLEGGPPRLAVGASYKIDLADGERDAINQGAELDALLKAYGFDLQLGFFLMKLDQLERRYGAMAQFGHFFDPVQPVLRFAMVEIDGGERLIEARWGFNWYFSGHAWKWATDFGVLLETGGEDEPDLQLRTMLQMTF